MEKEIIAIIMYGYPATGKTFISKKLGNFLKKKYKVINVATLDIRKKFNLFNLKSESQRNLSYNLVSEEVENLVRRKDYEIIIIDGNFNKKVRREKLYSSLKNSKIYIIHCIVPDEKVINQRILERQKDSFTPENRADTMDLYYLIKNSGDNLYKDSFISAKEVNLIRFNSEKNIVEGLKINEEDKNSIITKEIIETLTR